MVLDANGRAGGTAAAAGGQSDSGGACGPHGGRPRLCQRVGVRPAEPDSGDVVAHRQSTRRQAAAVLF